MNSKTSKTTKTTYGHTPGPWTFDETWHLIVGPSGSDDEQIAAIHGSELVTREQARANALLIAAAPDLLGAAKEAESALSDIINAADNKQAYSAKELADQFGKYTAMLHAAIAKAEGGK